MAVSKTSPEFWNKYKGFSYEQFVKEFAKGNSFKMSDIPGYSAEVNKFIPKNFFAYMDKYNANYKKFGNAFGEQRTSIDKSVLAKNDVGNAKTVINKAANSAALNKLYTQYRSYTDSMKLYNKAANKKGLTNYQSQLDKVLAQIKALGGTVPKY